MTSILAILTLDIKESGTENRLFVRIRFRRPTSAQLSRAVKGDEISVVEPTQPLRLAQQSKIIKRLGQKSQPLYIILIVQQLEPL